MMTTRVRPTAGTAHIGGVDVVKDPVRARRQLAVVPQRSNLDRSISIRDNLIFHAAYHGVPGRERERRADDLLEQFGLLDRARDKPDFFSGGQSQRVMIARALMHAPRVLFLDEPTTGLDPAARLFVWDRLRELRESGVTLVLTTHDMDEAAVLADRVGIMDHGRLLALDTPDALIGTLEGEGTLELAADLPADLAQVILQPLFMLFVFGKVLGSLGFTRHGYANLLFPGLLALTAVITAMQTLAFPLVAEFGWTKEIEDRLMAPMPTSFVAAEKVLFALLRSFTATLIMIPVGILVLGSIPWRWSGFPLFLGGLLLGALVGAGFGLLMGTLVQPQRINLLFSLVFTPLLFTGCSQYPWPSLARLRWFQVVTAANPMTYVSEALRGALVPAVPHIRPWICLLVLVFAVSVLMAVGVRGFYRRAID